MRGVILLVVVACSLSQAWAIGPVLRGKCRLSWNAPTMNVNGTPLDDLDGYAIFLTRVQGVYDWSARDDRVGPQRTEVKCPPEAIAEDGQYYAVVRAIDAMGRLGLPSNEFAFVIKARPEKLEERAWIDPADPPPTVVTPGERLGW